MLTEEMKMTTESILMSYYFEMSEWLMGNKVVNTDILQKSKADMLELLKEDLEQLEKTTDNEYVNDLQTAIDTLEEVTEEQYQMVKMVISSWEPVSEN